MDLKTYLDESKLLSVFRKFDTDNSGYLTQDNIFYAMQKMGYFVPKDQIAKMVFGADEDGDKTISYEEFKLMF